MIIWFDMFAIQGDFKSLLQAPHFESINSWCSAFFMVQLSHLYDYWKNHSFDYTDLCQQSDVSTF